MSRVAINMATDIVPVHGADELDKHLDELIADPQLALNVKLFDDVELQITDANLPPLIPRLLPKIAEILKQYQNDPAPLCSMATKLLGPLNLTQVLSLAPEEAIIQALRSPAPSANILAMAILEKAAKSPGESAVLAIMQNLVSNFVSQWLSAPQVEVGEKASRVLGALLDTDCDVARPQDGLALNGMEIAVRQKPLGQGLLWRRLFHDRQIYELILSLCSDGPHRHEVDDEEDDDEDSAEERRKNSLQQLTLAQGRLLRVLPRLAALNLGAVTHTEFPELHERYCGTSFSSSGTGLLQFAALHMIDRSDILMRLSLVDFFETLLSIQRITPYSPYKMDCLRALVRDATAVELDEDGAMRAALRTLPDRTIPDESEELKRFLTDLGVYI